MSTKSTANTQQLFTIISPFATMLVHATFKYRIRSTAERIEIFSMMSVFINVDDNPVLTGHIGSGGPVVSDSSVAIAVEHSVETLHVVTSHKLQLVGVHTAKS